MKTIRMTLCLLVLACLALAAAGAAFAEADPAPGISASHEIAYVGKYVWRGLALNPDGAVQPSVTVSHPSGLSFNLWGSMDTTDFAGESGRLTELDYTLDYSWEAGSRSMSAGIIHYTFPNTGFDSTDEVYLCTSFTGRLSPTLALNYDFKEANGYYLSLGAGYDCPLPGKRLSALGLSAKLSFGSAGHNEFYFFGVDKAALNDVLFSASVPIPLANKLTINPSLSYSRVLNRRLRDALDSNNVKPDNLFAGVTMSFAL